MPIMNGFEATKYIRNTMNFINPMYLPVDVEKSKSIGMNDYHHFEKP
jgi:hypothetical protein